MEAEVVKVAGAKPEAAARALEEVRGLAVRAAAAAKALPGNRVEVDKEAVGDRVLAVKAGEAVRAVAEASQRGWSQ
jgi:hypothetical protein